MYCKFCGSKIDDDSVFCSICGGKQIKDAPVSEQAQSDITPENGTSVNKASVNETSVNKTEEIKELSELQGSEVIAINRETAEEAAQRKEERESVSYRFSENVNQTGAAVYENKPRDEYTDEFIDVFAYWSEMSALKKLGLIFVFTAAAMWAAMLVLSVFFV
ncbi:MAG: zinc ribbon domain-containing protein [Firmicutes bacterium]|nr:zinc ribbon domain-containing protein [Bacillota bacterium]